MTDGYAGDPAVQAEWDKRYADQDRLWSGRPNGALVAEVAASATATASSSSVNDSTVSTGPNDSSLTASMSLVQSSRTVGR